ncbi:MAG: 2OG-Fe dioxygenase family protein [Rhizomicrobium sp.]
MSEQSKFIAMMSMLLKRGYSVMDAASFGLSKDQLRELAALGQSALAAPIDANCVDGTRRRRFERALVVPGSTEIIFFPRRGDSNFNSVQSYQQSAAYNPVEGGKERPFEAFTEIQRNLPSLKELILLDAEIARLVSPHPDAIQEAHLHLIAYVPTHGSDSVSSPPFVHCDSEPITFAHLLGRNDVTGGFNAVTTIKGRNLEFDKIDETEVLTKFTLESLMSTFVVVDDVVAHYVSPIHAVGENPYRVVLLIDFTPLLPAKRE